MNLAPFHIGKYLFDPETAENPQTQERREEAQRLMGQSMQRFQLEQTSAAASLDPKGDIDSLIYEVFDGDMMIGAFIFYAITVLGETDDAIRIAGYPMPAFAGLSLDDDAQLVADGSEYLLNNDLPVTDGKNLRIEQITYYRMV